jgi:hypothetical protein
MVVEPSAAKPRMASARMDLDDVVLCQRLGVRKRQQQRSRSSSSSTSEFPSAISSRNKQE